jgi:hypothetical protein
MQMTDSYAAAVAVTIPIMALAAGGEARAIRERIQKPHEEWERQYREYVQQRPLDLDGTTDGVIEHILELPKLPGLYKAERAIALLGAVVWLIVFTLLAVVELLTLQWLADGDPAGHSGLAGLAFWAIALGFAALIVAPMAYLALPVFLSLDLLPAGLRKNITGQIAEGRGKTVAKGLARESGGAFNRVLDGLEQEARKKLREQGYDDESAENKRVTVNVGPRQFARLLKAELAGRDAGGSEGADAEGADADAEADAGAGASAVVEPAVDPVAEPEPPATSVAPAEEN